MTQRREDFCFALEPRHAFAITSERFWQDLDGYIAAKLGITGTVDFTHAARTNSGEDFIGAQVGAGLNGHRSPPTGICVVYTTCLIYEGEFSIFEKPSRKNTNDDSNSTTSVVTDGKVTQISRSITVVIASRNMLAAGVFPQAVAMKTIGHRIDSMLRRYAIVDEEQKRAALAKTQRCIAVQVQAERYGIEYPRRVACCDPQGTRIIDEDNAFRCIPVVAWVAPTASPLSSALVPDCIIDAVPAVFVITARNSSFGSAVQLSAVHSKSVISIPEAALANMLERGFKFPLASTACRSVQVSCAENVEHHRVN